MCTHMSSHTASAKDATERNSTWWWKLIQIFYLDLILRGDSFMPRLLCDAWRQTVTHFLLSYICCLQYTQGRIINFYTWHKYSMHELSGIHRLEVCCQKIYEISFIVCGNVWGYLMSYDKYEFWISTISTLINF